VTRSVVSDGDVVVVGNALVAVAAIGGPVRAPAKTISVTITALWVVFVIEG
jgi:hypothetical protein